ncbi:intestinal mucin-like protein [Patiria miniata]|uniref:CTCK domain-containing protein n=1 Tax=Patiria miniata TaxID=46514 RepID=A0A913YZT6_PATMI|nr:intestinal mucin-like protein [Patiria miniata]
MQPADCSKPCFENSCTSSICYFALLVDPFSGIEYCCRCRDNTNCDYCPCQGENGPTAEKVTSSYQNRTCKKCTCTNDEINCYPENPVCASTTPEGTPATTITTVKISTTQSTTSEITASAARTTTETTQPPSTVTTPTRKTTPPEGTTAVTTEETGNCIPTSFPDVVVINKGTVNCTSVEKVLYTGCRGGCGESDTRVEMLAMSQLQYDCHCCKPSAVYRKFVGMACTDGSKFDYHYYEIAACACNSCDYDPLAIGY